MEREGRRREEGRKKEIGRREREEVRGGVREEEEEGGMKVGT